MQVEGPLRVDNGTEDSLDLLLGSTFEFVVDTGNPVAGRVGVNLLDMFVEVNWSLIHEEISNIIVSTEFEVLASLLEVIEVDFHHIVGLSESLFHESGEEFHDSVDFVVVSVTSLSHSLSAEFAGELSLGTEGVDASLGGNSEGSKSNKFGSEHDNV